MRWQGSRKSSNIEDRRGMKLRGAPLGVGATVVALGVAYVFGIDPRVVMGLIQGGSALVQTQDQQGKAGTPQDEAAQFMAAVLGETEDTWTAIFQASGQQYVPPTLVLFSDQVNSACGSASAAVGPFYCPGDSKVYIDLSFYDELKSKFQAPGDFAQAYVLAHEVGHHIQNLTGVAEKVHNAKRSASEKEANQMQVRMELQADCYAGVWAHNADRARQILEQGDVEEALGAASAVGDDTLQRRAQGRVVPDSFTHGSAEQRMSWFRRGLDQGTVQACDTFQASAP